LTPLPAASSHGLHWACRSMSPSRPHAAMLPSLQRTSVPPSPSGFDPMIWCKSLKAPHRSERLGLTQTTVSEGCCCPKEIRTEKACLAQVSRFEQTSCSRGWFHFPMRFGNGMLVNSARPHGAKGLLPGEDLVAGHDLVFKGITGCESCEPPLGYERAGRGFGICQQLGLWKKRCARPLCL
jgi:hypothetical protein